MSYVIQYQCPCLALGRDAIVSEELQVGSHIRADGHVLRR